LTKGKEANRGQDMPENRKNAEIYVRKLHEMLPELKERYNVSYLGVFGSYIRGEQKAGSDLDILVEFSKTPTIFKFVNLENYLSDALGVKVDLVMKDALKPNIGKHILSEVEAV
jgi:predicted nucleotidyltransferase